MNDKPKATIARWTTEPLSKDVAQSIACLAEADDVQHVAVMPDVHLAEAVCVGVAVGTQRTIYPAAVGSDIGCGMLAIAFDASADVLSDERTAARVLSVLYERVSSLRRPRARALDALPEDLQQAPLSHPSLERLKPRDARVQFGTLRRGNHFLEFQRDDEGRLWLMVHSGSRGIGQTISTYHRSQLEPTRGNNVLIAFDAESSEGRAYLADVEWAVRYAAQNRRTMVDDVAEWILAELSISIDESSMIHCDHNHVRREVHFGKSLWVHRKGALSADEGAAGVIPGSMGTASFHVTGRGCEASLRSSSHGAGRKMSRADAARTIGARQMLREMSNVWFDHRRVNRLRDEAPSAYKDIGAVMRAQRELTRVVREVRPVLNYKGV